MIAAYQRYKQQEVLTASPIELIVMLYDGCIKNLKLARINIQEKKYENANISLQKAQRIIMELIDSLDFHYPIAKDLFNIYQFTLQEIYRINAEKSAQAIEGIVNILSELRQAWASIVKVGSLTQIEEQSF